MYVWFEFDINNGGVHIIVFCDLKSLVKDIVQLFSLELELYALNFFWSLIVLLLVNL